MGSSDNPRPFEERAAAHGAVMAALASKSNLELIHLLDHGLAGRRGIGGSTQEITVAGHRVFVKLLRLTTQERDAGSTCTTNLFRLPTWYQYGVGSAGFNAWREVAAHEVTTEAVLTRRCENFPLVYHWRQLATSKTAADPTGIEREVRFWRGSPAVRRRLGALAESSSVVALFLETVPLALRPWLTTELAAGASQAERAVLLVEQQLFAALAFLRSAGLVHFDAHFDNVLTDGHRLYLSDFGLATARQFQHSSTEQRFVARAGDHDLAYCAAALVNLIVQTRLGLSAPGDRNDYIRRCAEDGAAAELGRLAETVVRYAPVATVVNDFYWQLHGGNVTAPYPAAGIARALEGIVRNQ